MSTILEEIDTTINELQHTKALIEDNDTVEFAIEAELLALDTASTQLQQKAEECITSAEALSES